MKIRNILSIKKLAVLGICVSFVAGGCGKMTESSIPKLEEPVALNEAYRPVEYGTIGSIQVLMATAVPRDYCNYYSANVNISQIYVEPGDTVNVGDVLAVCDVDEAKNSCSNVMMRWRMRMRHMRYPLRSRIRRSNYGRVRLRIRTNFQQNRLRKREHRRGLQYADCHRTGK